MSNYTMFYVCHNIGNSDPSVKATKRGVTARVFITQSETCELETMTDEELIEKARLGIAKQLGCNAKEVKIQIPDGRIFNTAKEAEENK